MRHKDDKKRVAISDAAIQLITTIGFADTSMSKIAKAAGVSPATIYVYFDNKEDLLNQLFIAVKREISEAMLVNYDESMSVEAAVKQIWHNAIRYNLNNPTKFAFSEQFSHSPLVHRVSREEGASHYWIVAEIFERGKQEGIFKEIPYVIFAAQLFAVPINLLKRHLAGDILFDEGLQAKTFQFTWASLTC